MQKKDLIENNPLRVFAQDGTGKQINQRMGLVMARAGLGKTAILVQIALDNILRGNQVLHVSVGTSLDKTRVWYDDILNDISTGAKLEDPEEIREAVMRNRLIMTFKEAGFTRPKLEERLNDLLYQNVFRPACVVIDGFDFAEAGRQSVADIREMMEVMDLQVWFSALVHRDDDRVSAAGVPAPCHEVDDLFDTVVLVQPEGDAPNFSLNVVKDTTGCVKPGKAMALDPSTYLVKKA
jgi:hypothetical protein